MLCAALLAFLLTCVFDPADRLFGLKVEIFLACWFVLALHALMSRRPTRLHSWLLVFVLIFLVVPLASIAWYVFWRGGEPFAGFQLPKGYVLVTLALLLYLVRVNLTPYLAEILVFLALAVIGLFVLLMLVPGLLGSLYLAGASTGVFILDDRDYGGGLVLRQVYFVTSPMLALAIAHYFNRMQEVSTRNLRIWFFCLTAICVAGMFLAGTRNNMAVSLLLPAVLFLLGSRRMIEAAILSSAALLSLMIIFSEQMMLLLDPTEVSNSMKLMLLQDYDRLLSDPVTLFLGSGLGSYDYWNTRAGYGFISELTYLEMVRNFGVFGALTMMALLLFPLLYAFVLRPGYPERHLIISYAFYLLMCVSNPNLFSSMGILILSIIVANIFVYESSCNLSRSRGVI